MTDFKAWIPPAGAVVDPPCHPETVVDVIYSDRSEEDLRLAGDLNWSAFGDGPCVVAYAVVKEYTPAPKVAREWWIAPSGFAYVSQEQAEPKGFRTAKSIHVREVLQGREVVAWAVVRDGQRLLLTGNEIAAGQYADDHGGTVVRLAGVMPNE